MNIKHLLLTSLAIMAALTTRAAGNNATEWQNTSWTDGFTGFTCLRINGNIASFEGGTLHEGGYGFTLTPHATAGTWVLHPLGPEFDYTSLHGQSPVGSTVKRTVIDGEEFLVVRNPQGMVTDVLSRMTGMDNLYHLITRDLLYNLSGRYTDKNGNQYHFLTSGTLILPGNPAVVRFLIEETYDMPTNVITLADGRHWMYQVIEGGLELYTATFDKETEDWNQGTLVARLTKQPTLDAELGEGPYGCWPETSLYVLSSNYVSFYDRVTLRLMRNEIYARHGVKFSSPDLKARFSTANGWPKATIDASSARLSEIELINVDLIRNMEALIDKQQ